MARHTPDERVRRSTRRRAPLAALLLTLLAGLLAAGVGDLAGVGATARAQAPAAAVPPRGVVLVQMDDASLELLATMPHAVAMQRRGATYDDAFVVDSLCCPSRAATFTGRPPHLTGVLTNTSTGPLGPQGGWIAFRDHHDVARSVSVALQGAGWRTGYVGKYLNEYEPREVDGRLRPPPYVRGWDDFEQVSGGAYSGWGFARTHVVSPGHLGLTTYPVPPRHAPERRVDRTYGTQVISDRATALLQRYQSGTQPFFLQVAPYAPHQRLAPAWPGDPMFPAALRDRPSPQHPAGNCGTVRCGDLHAADLPGYLDDPRDNRPVRVRDGRVSPAPAWHGVEPGLTPKSADVDYRDRVRMVQSVDRLLARVLAVAGPNTYVVLTSDNGYHLDQLSLGAGKGTPYDADVHVPLVVVGPGVVPGHRSQLVSNIDLAPTLEQLAGLAPSRVRAGVGFAPSLTDPTAAGSRYVFFEHTHGPQLPGEPDAPLGSGLRLDRIPSYVAVRSERGLLVRVDLDPRWRHRSWAWELYDYRTSPWERTDLLLRHPGAWQRPWVQDLRRRLVAWADCDPARCRALRS